MQPISSQIEDIFLGNSRAESTESLIEIILAACIAPHQIPERLITEHAMLLAILHGNIGSEVGMYGLVQLFNISSHSNLGCPRLGLLIGHLRGGG